ncbi:MAG: Rdx family protein, partial [Planctomycetota bacterium]
MPKAASLAEAIKGRFNVESELIKGGGGIFDVHLNGDLIYSKHETGRFPEHDEVL